MIFSTSVKMMSARYQILEMAYQAMVQTGQVLIRLMPDGACAPIELNFGSDLGFTYSIIKLCQAFNLSLAVGVQLFYLLALGISAFVAVIGLGCFAKTHVSRLIVFFGVTAITYLAWRVGDEYVVSFCALAYAPLILFSFERARFKCLGFFLVVLGFVAAYCNFLRMHTGTTLVLITLFLLYVRREKLSKKLLLFLLLCAGYGVQECWISKIFAARDAYLQLHGYTDDVQDAPLKKHVFWHNIYAGLGFIENDKNLYYADACSAEKVASVDSSIVYTSPAYEAVLRHEVFNLIYTSPNYVARCMFAKFGVLLYYALLCLLPALWTFYFYSKYMPVSVHVAYWIAMIWGAAPGMLTIPNALYLFGFIVSALLYSIHMLVYVFNRHAILFNMSEGIPCKYVLLRVFFKKLKKDKNGK